MTQTISLSEARKNLSQLTDEAYAGNITMVSRRGRELAVLIGVKEYWRLKEIENQQRKQDFDILLAAPAYSALSEDEARQLAIHAVREVRAEWKD